MFKLISIGISNNKMAAQIVLKYYLRKQNERVEMQEK